MMWAYEIIVNPEFLHQLNFRPTFQLGASNKVPLKVNMPLHFIHVQPKTSLAVSHIPSHCTHLCCVLHIPSHGKQCPRRQYLSSGGVS